MATQTKRTTIYMDAELHRALRIKAAENSSSISKMVNHAGKMALAEDAEDLTAFEERAKEPLRMRGLALGLLKSATAVTSIDSPIGGHNL